MTTWNKIFRKKTISYQDYQKAISKKFRDSLSYTKNGITSKENIEIIEKYNWENKYNFFETLDIRFNSNVKYGSLVKFAKKSLIILLGLMLVTMFFMSIQSVVMYVYLPIAVMIVFLSFITIIFEPKYLSFYMEYEITKKDPNWERKQKFKRLLK